MNPQSISQDDVERQARTDRRLVLAAITAGLLSVSLLLVASLSTDLIPTWAGIIDVLLVLAIAAAWFALVARTRNRVPHAAYRWSYTIAAVLPALILVAIWIFRDQLDMNILLPGLAWRIFVLLQFLPVAYAAWSERPLIP